MKNNISILFLSFLLFLSSCFGQKKESVKIVDIQIEEIAEIEISKIIFDLNDFIQPYAANHLIFYNFQGNIFSKLDFSDMSLKEICRLDEKQDIRNWFYDQHSNRICIISEDSITGYDFTGTQIEKYAIPTFKNGFFEISNERFRPLVKNNTIYFYLFPNVTGNYTNPAFYKHPVEGVMDLKSKQLKRAGCTYPENYQRNCYGVMYAPQRIEIDDHRHAYFFPYNDSVFVYDWITGKHSKHFLGSYKEKTFKYVDFKEAPKLNQTVYQKLLHTNPFYQSGGYAPLSKVYYRTLYSFDKDTEKQSDKNEPIKTKTTIVFYDKKFYYIGESDLNGSPGFMADSDKGLLSLIIKDQKIIIRRISWKE